jgi:hypothetical protein
MDSATISLISACTALVATIAGPVVTLRVARRQFGATVLSANRQRWIEGLRELISELAAHIIAIVQLKQGWRYGWEEGLAKVAADPQAGGGVGMILNQRTERIAQIFWKVRLMTNPAEPEHLELCQAIESILEKLKTPEIKPGEMRPAVEHMTRLAQVILKQEWQRVKRGL